MRIVDIHAHPLLNSLYRQGAHDRALSIDALVRGQVGVLFSSIYPHWSLRYRQDFMAQCRQILQTVEAHVANHSERATVARTWHDLDLARSQHKIAFVHAIEGGHVLQGRSQNLDALYAWGVRSLTLAHFVNNDLTAATFDPRRRRDGRGGLSLLGAEVVARMNDLGMIVDLAHCSERAFWQTLALTRQPVIVSHTGVRRLVPWEVCLSDAQLGALAQNGGLAGVILSAAWARRSQLAAGIPDLVRNILHACEVAGVEHVAIGSDLNAAPRRRGVASAADLPRIAEELAAQGLDDETITRIMGGNMLRVMEQVMGSRESAACP